MIQKKTLLLKIFISAFSLFIISDLSSKVFNFNYSINNKFQLKVRSNIKVYINNKYIGLQTNEIKGILNINDIGNDIIEVNGNVYFYNKAFRDKINIGCIIENTEECGFFMDKYGIMSNSKNPIFPPIQNIPFFPDKELKINDTYKGIGRTSIYFYDSDKIDLVEIQPVFKYSGKKAFSGIEYDFFEISYNLIKTASNNYIKNARGMHNLELYFDSAIGKPVFMKDEFIDELELLNNDKMRRNGFILYFYSDIVPMNKDKIINDMTDDIDKDLLKDLDFKKKKEGISITINNLKFKANSTELLDSEKNKLGKLYEMLSQIKNRSFLIIGHTAKFGSEEEQMKLSTQRAKAIVDYLRNKGISADKLFYQGKGSKEPVANNDTEENMQKNRRVEIIILED